MNIIAMIRVVGQLRDAMEAGRQVADPKSWKEKQITSNRVMAILSLVVVVLRLSGADLPISDENIIIISGGIAAILLGVNNIIAIATSRKLGKEAKL